MLSIIGSLLGFASSTAPAIMDHFASKEDRKHELNKMRAMADMRKEGMELDMQFYERMGADKEHERLIQHDVSINKGTGIIAGLQKSVRPVITYAFFTLFATIEIVLLMEALEKGTEFSEAIQLLWDEDTKAIFAAIISFWFGSRAVEKARKRA
tara:strand:+ start:432 stop:893 length:462 start_codon:yes stop_codon:yes gene_type:complete